MRYLDLEHGLAQHQPAAKPRWRRPIKLAGLTLLLAGLVYGAYVLFWPATATLSDLFKAPAAVLSFIRPPEEGLKLTDGRTNILLLGSDSRPELPGENLTDTIMVASIDLQGKKKDVVLISIPRDLWVKLPAWKYGQDGGLTFYAQGAKINAANTFGDLYSYQSGGGPGLAREVVQQVLGLPIHYVVRVNFAGFQSVIETLGGISINVETDFTDCEYPTEGRENYFPISARFECISFEKGYQYMDALITLRFVRSRHGNNGEGSDLARAKRQQKVLLAIRDKVLTIQTLADPLKVSGIIKSLGDTVKTVDVDFSQIGQFYHLAQQIDVGTAANIVLTNDPKEEAGLLAIPPADVYGGAFVFIPRAGEGNYREIQTYVRRKLAEASTPEVAPPAPPTAP